MGAPTASSWFKSVLRRPGARAILTRTHSNPGASSSRGAEVTMATEIAASGTRATISTCSIPSADSSIVSHLTTERLIPEPQQDAWGHWYQAIYTWTGDKDGPFFTLQCDATDDVKSMLIHEGFQSQLRYATVDESWIEAAEYVGMYIIEQATQVGASSLKSWFERSTSTGLAPFDYLVLTAGIQSGGTIEVPVHPAQGAQNEQSLTRPSESALPAWERKALVHVRKADILKRRAHHLSYGRQLMIRLVYDCWQKKKKSATLSHKDLRKVEKRLENAENQILTGCRYYRCYVDLAQTGT